MNSLLAELPEDARRLIEERLGSQVDDIAAKTRAQDLVIPRDKSHVPLTIPPITAFYWACVKALERVEEKRREGTPPSPAWAWLEVLRSRYEKNPQLSHPKISETIMYFGGWQHMWAEFNTITEDKARNKFLMGYKDIAGLAATR